MQSFKLLHGHFWLKACPSARHVSSPTRTFVINWIMSFSQNFICVDMSVSSVCIRASFNLFNSTGLIFLSFYFYN